MRALGLKLLLSKLGREAQSHQDADLHRQAAQSLHRHVRRNQAVLGHELAQLRAASASASAGSPVPDVSDPLWQALLSGECELEVRTLSLRLLLSKLRQQARPKVVDGQEVVLHDWLLARPLPDHRAAFARAAALQPPARAPVFCCNCILNHVHGRLQGQRTGAYQGPMTFGEIGYQLLNQTRVHLTVTEA